MKKRMPANNNVDIDLIESIYGNSIVFASIDREQVEAQATDWLIDLLEILPEDSIATLRFAGYENDPREVWEVPEVRDYVRTALTRAPHILRPLTINDRALLRDCMSEHHIVSRNDGMMQGVSVVSDLWFDIVEAAGVNHVE